MGFPMPTAMTMLGRLGKDHMFLWAWGINGCFSVIGAALVPIVATSFGLPAVVLVGAFAYLVAMPAFFSVLMPLHPGGRAARRCVKRRALLLGALLMPTAAHAQTKQSPEAKPAKPPRSRRRAKAAPPATNAAAGRTAAAQGRRRPSSSPSTPRPFPIAASFPTPASRSSMCSDGKRRGHTTPAGRRLLGGHDLQRPPLAALFAARLQSAAPGLIVLYLHGQGATLERDVRRARPCRARSPNSGQNVALVAPQLAFDAADSSAGNFWKPGHFAAYIDEAAERLMRLYGDQRAGCTFQASRRGDRRPTAAAICRPPMRWRAAAPAIASRA